MGLVVKRNTIFFTGLVTGKWQSLEYSFLHKTEKERSMFKYEGQSEDNRENSKILIYRIHIYNFKNVIYVVNFAY